MSLSWTHHKPPATATVSASSVLVSVEPFADNLCLSPEELRRDHSRSRVQPRCRRQDPRPQYQLAGVQLERDSCNLCDRGGLSADQPSGQGGPPCLDSDYCTAQPGVGFWPWIWLAEGTPCHEVRVMTI